VDTPAPAKSARMILEYNEIVIGSNLTAVLYAFNNKLPIFFTVPERPFRFDYLDPAQDIACVGMENVEHSLTTHSVNINVGTAKELLWERLLFLISLAGRAPLSTFCESMRHNGESIVCSNEYSKIAEIKFEKAYYFGDAKCSGLVKEKPLADPRYICYDWVAFNQGGKHDIDYIKTGDDFVSEIWFYSSDRIDGNTPVKDACAVSIIKEEDIFNFDFSETSARFKTTEEMYKRGMKGKFNGHCPKYGHPKYYRFKTSHISRRKEKNKTTISTRESAIKVTKTKEQTLLRDLPASCLGYDRYVRHFVASKT